MSVHSDAREPSRPSAKTYGEERVAADAEVERLLGLVEVVKNDAVVLPRKADGRQLPGVGRRALSCATFARYVRWIRAIRLTSTARDVTYLALLDDLVLDPAGQRARARRESRPRSLQDDWQAQPQG